MPLKDVLLAPGPSQVPERVRFVLAEQSWYHRSARFKALYKECRERLGRVFETQKSDIVIFAGSGTASMEASIVNAIPKGKKALLVSGGKWGERLVSICKAFEISAEVIKIDYGCVPDPNLIADALKKDPSIAAVYVHLCETSTGAKYDVKSIGEVVRATPALLAVDAISGAVGMECPIDAWGVDFFMAGSQKGLMMPPGLAVLTVSQKAWSVVDTVAAPAYYFSLKQCKKVLPDNDTPFTPANTLIAAQNEALKMIEEEGPKNVLARHAILAQAARAGTAALGLEQFPKVPAEVLTVVKAPAGLDGSAVVKAAKSRFGVTLADGQGDMKGKVIRIAHMGYCSAMDVIVGIAALELGLKAVGANVALGKGVAAAQEVLAKAPKEVTL
ncbi:MAG TPA: alanine--glyoxylate aminotransferase family protein [Planctomycetota bacterium]|nr:alanine--glyoxylate aminotransferase family protein [Planctomycetota bacterium]